LIVSATRCDLPETPRWARSVLTGHGGKLLSFGTSSSFSVT
jgi:hypothetical protein